LPFFFTAHGQSFIPASFLSIEYLFFHENFLQGRNAAAGFLMKKRGDVLTIF